MGKTVKKQKRSKVIHKYNTKKVRGFNRNKLSQIEKGMSKDDIDTMFEEEDFTGKVDVINDE